MRKKNKFPIDLSMLTDLEIQQFVDDPSTLYDGDIDVCLYLRFSSERQGEQSIEGQLRDCREYCKRNSFRIVAIYVDRAKTARQKVEKRVFFQQMVQDSAKRAWKMVVVWKLDRFSRNRTDSAIYKSRLRKNGVRVMSATESITDSPEGIILESVLEGMAEFYSAELSQKITRGMRESALKHQNVGGHVPLGYRIENKKLVINPVTAPIVLEAFTRYADGESVADICARFNDLGYKTAKGAEFNKNSFHAMFRNERYIGTYTYKDIQEEGVIPAIVPQEVWERVQDRLKENSLAPARGKALVDYMLVGKLFCGHCASMMVGESGTGKSGKKYNYYTCAGRKRKKNCRKRPLKKDWFETLVAEDTKALLTDELINELADMAIQQSEKDLQNNTIIPELEAKLSETSSGISNIISMVEKGVASETLARRLTELEKEKRDLERRLVKEKKNIVVLEKPHIVHWLKQFQSGNIDDPDFRRKLIDLLVNSVTVWDGPDDDELTITYVYNLTDGNRKTVRVKNGGNPSDARTCGGSDMALISPPLKGYPNTMFMIGMMFGYTAKHRHP